MVELGVNIDHVATVRQARQTNEPDPVWAAVEAELGGANCITIHLREDRRHIQDRDVRVLRETVAAKLNLELACVEDVLRLACETQPYQATLVPERREEVTTEGGLNLAIGTPRIAAAVEQLKDAGLVVILFVDPDHEQISLAKKLGADAVELHTGAYANSQTVVARSAELEKLHKAGRQIIELGMHLHAGHGLTYHNVRPIAALPHLRELHIGHSIVARAIMVGMRQAVREMKQFLESP